MKINYSRPLRVWYGWEKLNKVKKHEALCIIYEDSIQHEDRTMNFVNKSMKVSYVRNQTEEEMKDAALNNRCFFVYSSRLDRKEFNGSLYLCLLNNFIADSNNLNEKVRKDIWKKLEEDFISQHPLYSEPNSEKWIIEQKRKLYGILPDGESDCVSERNFYYEGCLF